MLDELTNINSLLLTNPNCKKRRLYKSFERDVNNLISKYEYLYYKHILKNKKIGRLACENERHLAIVQQAIEAFFPYILAHNLMVASTY